MKTKLFDQIYRCDSYGYSIKASVSLIVDIILQIKLLAPCYSYYLYVNSGREISMSISSRTDCRIYRAVIQVVIMQFAVLSTNVYAKLTLLGTTEFCVPCADSSFNSIVTVTSPDGRYLVYPSRATNAALYSVVTFGGKNPVELTNIDLRTVRGLNGENYKISPDSRRVIFKAKVGDSLRLFSVPIDGSGSPVEITGQESLRDGALGNFSLTEDSDNFFISDNSQLVVYSSSSLPPTKLTVGSMFIRSIDGTGQTVEIEFERALRNDPLLSSNFRLEEFGFVPEYVYAIYGKQIGDSNKRLKNLQIYSVEFGKEPEMIYALPGIETSPDIDSFQFTNDAKSIVFIGKESGENNQLFVEDIARKNRNRRLLSNPEDDVRRIVQVSEPWVLYTTVDSENLSGKNTKLNSIFHIEPNFLTNINQPSINHQINAKNGLFSLKKIVISQQKLIYTSIIANNDEGTAGTIKLISEPLQGSSIENPAVTLGEGPWKQDFDVGAIIPEFVITPDERWVIQTIGFTESAPGIDPEDNRWISLEDSNVSVSFVANSSFGWEFSPDTNRLLVSDSGLVDTVSRLGYDMNLVIDGEAGDLLPDGCRKLVSVANDDSLSTRPDINYYVTDCDRPLTELWWNPSLSGQGISTQQRSDRIQATWFVYDDAGEPLWLDFSGKLVNNQLTAPLLQFTGPELGSGWDNSKIQNEQLGTATLTLGDNKQSATLQYSVNGIDSTIQLQPFSEGPANLYNGYWWNPETSGRGVRLYRKGNELFGVAFLYDQTGKDIWLTFQGQLISDQFEGKLSRFTGPKLGELWDTGLVQHQEVGNVSLKFNANGRINAQFEVNGLNFDWNLQPFRF